MGQALLQPFAGSGTPVVFQGTNYAAVAQLVDPNTIRKNRHRFLRDDIPELDAANSFYAPSQRWPARGWVLVRRADYNNFNTYATNLQLQIDELTAQTSALTFNGLAIVQARCVSRGIAADPNAVYLVELTDARGVIQNPWADWPTTSQYNIIAPAYASQAGSYYSNTTNGGTAWTWSGMVGDLWGQMTPLGAYPGLPTTPSGTPEGFSFPGTSCWDAMNDILDLLGLLVTYNPTKTQPFGIGVIGAADAAFSALQAAAVGRLQEDLEYIDTGAGRAPGQVTVFFHRRNQYYGTEETVRQDSLQWQTTPLYSVTVTGPAGYSASAGTGYLWDDFTVRYDINGNPLVADTVIAASIAAERVTAYYNRMTRSTLGFLKQIYGGTLPFSAGSLVDAVAWKNDGSEREGWTTTLIRGPIPPFAQLDRSEPT